MKNLSKMTTFFHFFQIIANAMFLDQWFSTFYTYINLSEQKSLFRQLNLEKNSYKDLNLVKFSVHFLTYIKVKTGARCEYEIKDRCVA